MKSRYPENIGILKKLGCEVKDNGVLSDNEAILCARISGFEDAHRMIAKGHHNGIVAVQSAYIAGLDESPEEAMVWLHNYLWGPGLIPTEEEITAGAQAYSDKHRK